MNTHGMLLTIIIVFAIAAAGGLIMAGVRVLRQRNPPAWLAMAHGLLAGAELTLCCCSPRSPSASRPSRYGR